MKVIVKVEKQLSDKFYACYDLSGLENCNFGLSGYGKTAKEAIDDFLIAYRDIKEQKEVTGNEVQDLEFVYQYDLGAFFSLHPYLSIEGVAKKSGIGASLLRQYVSGMKKPSKKRIESIKLAIEDLAQEITISAKQINI